MTKYRKVNSEEFIEKLKNKKYNDKQPQFSLFQLENMISRAFFYSYKTDENTYNYKLVTDIIYNEKTRLVARFKDYLIFDDISEFCRRFYGMDESTARIKKLSKFYENYSRIFPNYLKIPESTYIYKNIRKKQKLIDKLNQIEEENKINHLNQLKKINEHNNNLKGDSSVYKNTIFNTDIKNSIYKYEPNLTNLDDIKSKINFNEESCLGNEIKVSELDNYFNNQSSNRNISIRFKSGLNLLMKECETNTTNKNNETIFSSNTNLDSVFQPNYNNKFDMDNSGSFNELIKQLEYSIDKDHSSIKEEKLNNFNKNILQDFLKLKNKNVVTNNINSLECRNVSNSNVYVPKLRNNFVNTYRNKNTNFLIKNFEKETEYIKLHENSNKNRNETNYLNHQSQNNKEVIQVLFSGFIQNAKKWKRNLNPKNFFYYSYIISENEGNLKNDFILKKILCEKYYINYVHFLNQEDYVLQKKLNKKNFINLRIEKLHDYIKKLNEINSIDYQKICFLENQNNVVNSKNALDQDSYVNFNFNRVLLNQIKFNNISGKRLCLEENINEKTGRINKQNNIQMIKHDNNEKLNIIIPPYSYVNINNNFYNLYIKHDNTDIKSYKYEKRITPRNLAKEKIDFNLKHGEILTKPLSSRINKIKDILTTHVELNKNEKTAINQNKKMYKNNTENKEDNMLLNKNKAIYISKKNNNNNNIMYSADNNTDNNSHLNSNANYNHDRENCFSTPRKKEKNQNNIYEKVVKILQDYSKPKNKNFINPDFMKDKGNKVVNNLLTEKKNDNLHENRNINLRIQNNATNKETKEIDNLILESMNNNHNEKNKKSSSKNQNHVENLSKYRTKIATPRNNNDIKSYDFNNLIISNELKRISETSGKRISHNYNSSTPLYRTTSQKDNINNNNNFVKDNNYLNVFNKLKEDKHYRFNELLESYANLNIELNTTNSLNTNVYLNTEKSLRDFSDRLNNQNIFDQEKDPKSNRQKITNKIKSDQSLKYLTARGSEEKKSRRILSSNQNMGEKSNHIYNFINNKQDLMLNSNKNQKVTGSSKNSLHNKKSAHFNEQKNNTIIKENLSYILNNFNEKYSTNANSKANNHGSKEDMISNSNQKNLSNLNLDSNKSAIKSVSKLNKNLYNRINNESGRYSNGTNTHNLNLNHNSKNGINNIYDNANIANNNKIKEQNKEAYKGPKNSNHKNVSPILPRSDIKSEKFLNNIFANKLFNNNNQNHRKNEGIKKSLDDYTKKANDNLFLNTNNSILLRHNQKEAYCQNKQHNEKSSPQPDIIHSKIKNIDGLDINAFSNTTNSKAENSQQKHYRDYNEYNTIFNSSIDKKKEPSKYAINNYVNILNITKKANNQNPNLTTMNSANNHYNKLLTNKLHSINNQSELKATKTKAEINTIERHLHNPSVHNITSNMENVNNTLYNNNAMKTPKNDHLTPSQSKNTLSVNNKKIIDFHAFQKEINTEKIESHGKFISIIEQKKNLYTNKIASSNTKSKNISNNEANKNAKSTNLNINAHTENIHNIKTTNTKFNSNSKSNNSAQRIFSPNNIINNHYNNNYSNYKTQNMQIQEYINEKAKNMKEITEKIVSSIKTNKPSEHNSLGINNFINLNNKNPTTKIQKQNSTDITKENFQLNPKIKNLNYNNLINLNNKNPHPNPNSNSTNKNNEKYQNLISPYKIEQNLISNTTQQTKNGQQRKINPAILEKFSTKFK